MPFLCQYCKKFTSGIYKKTAKGQGILTPHTAPLQSFQLTSMNLFIPPKCQKLLDLCDIDHGKCLHIGIFKACYQCCRCIQGCQTCASCLNGISTDQETISALVTALCRCINNKVDFTGKDQIQRIW